MTNCWDFGSCANRIIEISWCLRNKASLNIVYRRIQGRCRFHVFEGNLLAKATQRYQQQKPTPFSSAWFKPVAIKRFRTDVLNSADTGTGRWILCYWTVIQNFYREKCFKFIIGSIHLATNSNSEAEVSTHDLWRQHIVCCRWRCSTIIHDVGQCYRSLWCSSQNTSIWVP